MLICDVFSAPGLVFCCRRKPVDQPAPSRDSQWFREELRCHPGASLRRSPQAPHLVPLHERLMMRPSSGLGECSVN